MPSRDSIPRWLRSPTVSGGFVMAAVLTSDKELGKATGLRSHKRYSLYNGALPASLLLFDLGNNEFRDSARSDIGNEAAAPVLSEGATMFANRIRKNRKRLSA